MRASGRSALAGISPPSPPAPLPEGEGRSSASSFRRLPRAARIATPAAPARPAAATTSRARRNGSSRAAAGRDRIARRGADRGPSSAPPATAASQQHEGQAPEPRRSQAFQRRPAGNSSHGPKLPASSGRRRRTSNVAGSSSNSQVAPEPVHLPHRVHHDARTVGRGVDPQQRGNAGQQVGQRPRQFVRPGRMAE